MADHPHPTPARQTAGSLWRRLRCWLGHHGNEVERVRGLRFTERRCHHCGALLRIHDGYTGCYYRDYDQFEAEYGDD